MKKRVMKKYIPRNTSYCYSIKNGKPVTCKWWRKNNKHEKQYNGYCMYIGSVLVIVYYGTNAKNVV